MNFDFSEDQRMVQNEVRAVLRETCPMSAVRSVLEGEARHVEVAWRQLGELGYLGVSIPEEYGGSGLGALELCLVAEEVGRAIAPLPFSSSIYLAAGAILDAGTGSQKEEHLPDLASGRRIGTLAVARSPSIFGIENDVRWQDGRLFGTRLPVPDGEIAHLAIVPVDHEAGPSLALVTLDQPAVTRETVGNVDPTRPHARLRFDGAVAELVGDPGAAERILERILDRAAVLIGFEQLGGADAALEMARDYSLTRYAFGRPIGSYQAIKHKLADVYVRNQIARGHCYYGAWAVSTDARDLPLAAAGVRVAATRAFDFAATESIQVHGGSGFTWELDCHLYYRRAQLFALSLGSLDWWRERLVREIETPIAV